MISISDTNKILGGEAKQNQSLFVQWTTFEQPHLSSEQKLSTG
jgi:hypothetical protein